MVTKKQLLANISKYSAEEIAEAVRAGVVDMYELSKETQGAFGPLLKRRVKEFVDNPPQPEPVVFEIARGHESAAGGQGTFLVEDYKVEETNAPLADAELVSPAAVPKTEEKGMFKKPFSFEGRIRRLEYALSIFLCYVVFFFLGAIMGGSADEDVSATILLIASIPLLWFVAAQSCKRCHDLGNSGWFQIIPLYCIAMLFVDGDKGDNEYGSNPKQ